MRSFHRSRGRILFEVLCALATSASCVGAWMQTGAWALLPAAAVAALYGFAHLFDLRRPKSAGAVEQERIEFEEMQPDLALGVSEPESVAHTGPEVVEAEESVEPFEPPPPKAGRKAKAPRKGGSRRASAPEEAKVTEPTPPAEAEVAWPVPSEEVNATQPVPPEDAEVASPGPADDKSHLPIEPLFEPEPFVRMQRRAFGRRGRI